MPKHCPNHTVLDALFWGSKSCAGFVLWASKMEGGSRTLGWTSQFGSMDQVFPAILIYRKGDKSSGKDSLKSSKNTFCGCPGFNERLSTLANPWKYLSLHQVQVPKNSFLYLSSPLSTWFDSFYLYLASFSNKFSLLYEALHMHRIRGSVLYKYI